MRHNKKVTHLGRTTSHKKALMRNMAAQILEHKEIKTTDAKAKELRRVVDRLITYGKKGSLHHRRLAFRFLQNKQAVTRLFDEIAPTFDEREGGYTRVVKLGSRHGDSAPVSVIQLVGFEAAAEKPKAKSTKKTKTAKKEIAEKATAKKESVKKDQEPSVSQAAPEVKEITETPVEVEETEKSQTKVNKPEEMMEESSEPEAKLDEGKTESEEEPEDDKPADDKKEEENKK